MKKEPDGPWRITQNLAAGSSPLRAFVPWRITQGLPGQAPPLPRRKPGFHARLSEGSARSRAIYMIETNHINWCSQRPNARPPAHRRTPHQRHGRRLASVRVRRNKHGEHRARRAGRQQRQLDHDVVDFAVLLHRRRQGGAGFPGKGSHRKSHPERAPPLHAGHDHPAASAAQGTRTDGAPRLFDRRWRAPVWNPLRGRARFQCGRPRFRGAERHRPQGAGDNGPRAVIGNPCRCDGG